MTNTVTPMLMPCPDCGGTDVSFFVTKTTYPLAHRAVCKNCGFSGPEVYLSYAAAHRESKMQAGIKRAIRSWNKQIQTEMK